MRFKFERRIAAVGWSTVNTLSGAVFSVFLSIEIVRLCSKDLWGSMVEVLLWFGLASHFLGFGNDGLLLKEFSLQPKNMSANWSKSLQARIWLYVLVCSILVFLPVEMRLKFLLLIFLSANFIYRSYDVVILFKRQFMISVLLETLGFILIAIYVWLNFKDVSLNRLLAVYALAELLKAIIIYFLFNREFKIPSFKFNMVYFSLALPFFLLEFTGLLQSKTDLICVTWFLSKVKIAQYQVYINFLLLVQSASGFILAPFIKTIYRMRNESIRKLSIRFFAFGFVLIFPAMFFVDLFVQFFYHFKVEPRTLVIGAFFIMPIFYYIIVIYQLFKMHKQKMVVIINITGVVISFTLNIILIPICRDGINGAIMAIAITQWIVLLMYAAIQRKLKTLDLAT